MYLTFYSKNVIILGDFDNDMQSGFIPIVLPTSINGIQICSKRRKITNYCWHVDKRMKNNKSIKTQKEFTHSQEAYSGNIRHAKKIFPRR